MKTRGKPNPRNLPKARESNTGINMKVNNRSRASKTTTWVEVIQREDF